MAALAQVRKMGKMTMPIAVVNGGNRCFLCLVSSPATEVGEYDVMGSLRGKAVELVKCETVDLSACFADSLRRRAIPGPEHVPHGRTFRRVLRLLWVDSEQKAR